MCEHFVARAAEPFRLDELWPFAERLERYGMAGFGWGAAWLTADGRLETHRDIRAFRDDPTTRPASARSRRRALLVHLRRPSKLSTLQLADTQPFLDPAGRFAFSHNGDLRDYPRARATRYQAQGRIAGRADTEVGQRWLEDAWADGPSPAAASCAPSTRPSAARPTWRDRADGAAVHYAGNAENPVFSSASAGSASCRPPCTRSTGRCSSSPRSARTERRLVRPGNAVALDRDGTASPA